MKFKLLSLTLMCFVFGRAFGQNIDVRILESINGPNSPGDPTWHFISNQALYTGIAVPVTMLAVGLANHDDKLKTDAYVTASALLVTEGETFFLKRIVKRKRPFIEYPDLIYGKSKETDYSFPSGHSSEAFALATSLSLSFPKWYVIAPSYLYAATVGYSRMYLGVHYPSDVLAGAIIGTGTSYLSFKVQKWLSKKRRPVQE